MNLTFEPWIPALRADGRRELFSLRDLFVQAHELRDLAAKPHERIALMRLLLCITQAALDGPADEAEWETCEPLIQPRVRDYLNKWKAAFELFGDGPRFLQLRDLRPGKESDEGNAATKLDLALATGNNSTLFDNRAGEDRTLASARSALNLLTFQCFAPGGRIGVAKWNGNETAGKGSSNHAPCTPSSMVHTLVLGGTLLETLHRNLVTRENVLDFHGPNRWGKPVWEQPVEKADDKAAFENANMAYLGRLVPLSRAIRLSDEGFSIILANGLDYPSFPVFREATATVIKRKDELALLPASTSRSLWRQLAAVTITRRAGADPVCGPLALIHATTVAETSLWVGALVTDKAKIEDVVESTYALPAGMFTDFGRAAYEKDDRKPKDDDAGAGMIGTLEFSSAVYYRYAALNLDLIADADHLAKLTADERKQVVDAFIRATLQAVPGARKNSMNAHTLPGFVLGTYKAAGQPVQLINAFEEPVRPKSGLLAESIAKLKAHHDALKKTWDITCEAEVALPDVTLKAFCEALTNHVN